MLCQIWTTELNMRKLLHGLWGGCESLLMDHLRYWLWSEQDRFVKSPEHTMAVLHSYSEVSFCKLWHCIGRGGIARLPITHFTLEWDGAQTTFELSLCELGLSSLCSDTGTSCFDAYYVNMNFSLIVALVECVHRNNLLVQIVLQTMVLI